MTAEFEHILQLSGGFGRYQWFMYACYMAVIFVVAPHNGFMIFGKLEPSTEEQCHFRNTSRYNESDFINQNNTCNKEIRFYSVTMEFDLMGSRLWIQGLMISIQYVAMMISSLVMGQISDRFGRKPAFVGCFIALVCISVAGSFSPNWQIFVCLRFFVGGFLTAVHPLSVLCLESVPQNWRLILHIGGFSAGSCYLAFLGYFIRDWRNLLIASNCTAPIALFLAYWIHESPKWLMERGNFDKAVLVFKKIGNWNKVANWSSSVFPEIEQQLKSIEKTRKNLIEKESLLTYWHLFHDWKATRILVTLIITRIVAIGLYWGLLLNTGKLSGDVSLNLFLTMVIMGSIEMVPFLVDKNFHKIGRRHMLIFAIASAWLCMCYSAVAYCTTLWQTIPISLNITAYIGISFSMVISSVVSDLCVVETTPTLLRSMGNSLVISISLLGGIIAPQVILLFDLWKPGPSLIFLAGITIAAVMVYAILPETKGKPLPDLPRTLTQNQNDSDTTLLQHCTHKEESLSTQ